MSGYNFIRHLNRKTEWKDIPVAGGNQLPAPRQNNVLRTGRGAVDVKINVDGRRSF